MRRTVYNHVKAFTAIAPAGNRLAGTVTGLSVDRNYGSEFYTSVMFVVHSGVITDGTHTVTIEHSDDDSVWDTAPVNDLQGSLPVIVAADDNELFELGYIGSKRYVRCNLVTSGAPVTGGFVDAIALLGVQPVRR